MRYSESKRESGSMVCLQLSPGGGGGDGDGGGGGGGGEWRACRWQ